MRRLTIYYLIFVLGAVSRVGSSPSEDHLVVEDNWTPDIVGALIWKLAKRGIIGDIEIEGRGIEGEAGEEGGGAEEGGLGEGGSSGGEDGGDGEGDGGYGGSGGSTSSKSGYDSPASVGSGGTPLSSPRPPQNISPNQAVVDPPPIEGYYYYGGASRCYLAGADSSNGITPYYVWGDSVAFYLNGLWPTEVYEYDYTLYINGTYNVHCFCYETLPCSCDYTNSTEYFTHLPSSRYSLRGQVPDIGYYINGSVDGYMLAAAGGGISLNPNIFFVAVAVLLSVSVFR